MITVQSAAEALAGVLFTEGEAGEREMGVIATRAELHPRGFDGEDEYSSKRCCKCEAEP